MYAFLWWCVTCVGVIDHRSAARSDGSSVHTHTYIHIYTYTRTYALSMTSMHQCIHPTHCMHMIDEVWHLYWHRSQSICMHVVFIIILSPVRYVLQTYTHMYNLTHTFTHKHKHKHIRTDDDVVHERILTSIDVFFFVSFLCHWFLCRFFCDLTLNMCFIRLHYSLSGI